MLSTNQTALVRDEAATLSCSLVGGEGGEGRTTESTIRWLKGGRVLSESRGTVSRLLTSQIKSDIPVFGKYSCVIVDLYYAEEKSLVLFEEGRRQTFCGTQGKYLIETVSFSDDSKDGDTAEVCKQDKLL